MKAAALQQAIYDRLSGYAPLTSVVGSRVYAKAPQPDDAGDGGDFPYLTIGPFNFTPWDTKTSIGQTVVVQVHIWDRPSASRSVTSTRALSDLVYDALHRYNLTVSGAHVVDCLFEGGSEDIGDPDGKTAHVPMLFRVTYTASDFSARLRFPLLMAA